MRTSTDDDVAFTRGDEPDSSRSTSAQSDEEKPKDSNGVKKVQEDLLKVHASVEEMKGQLQRFIDTSGNHPASPRRESCKCRAITQH